MFSLDFFEMFTVNQKLNPSKNVIMSILKLEIQLFYLVL